METSKPEKWREINMGNGTIQHPCTMEDVMKRDMDLIRSILLRIENAEMPRDKVDFSDLEAPKTIINSHLGLLSQAGLISLDAWNPGDDVWAVYGNSLTWEGHEFVGLLHDDSIWAEATKKIVGQVGSIALSLLTEALLSACRQKLGL
jgi:hypothetical protein